MTSLFLLKISVPENVLFRQLEDESVLLNLDSEIYFGLDDVGTKMWRALTETENIRSAYELLLAEYNVEEKRLEQDLTELVNNLKERDLIEVQNE